MGKKLSAWKTKGMNRDLSVSAFNPEFAFENMNLRLATNENNTVLSWVNEKGPAYVRVSITKPEEESDLTGNCIGTAVLNNYLVIFTAGNYQSSGSPDRIYRLNYEVDENGNKYFEGVRLFRGNLGFSVEHPLETLVSYESEHIQKVYWTDGINQPRLINIAPEYNASGEEIIPSYTSTSFDFVPTLQLDETVSVKKVTGGGGMFAPGVIQYSFTYYNKHGQESNIFYTTPLYYISYADRGASPEDKVDNTFKIIVYNLDTNFDYLRIYSIQRTSINSTPICKRIQDIEIVAGMTSASYTDTGMSGDSIDPTELLYKGGSGVHVGTMDQKDNTLFMGNLTVLNTAPPELTDAEKAELLRSLSDEVRTFYVDIESSDNYVYGNQLTAMNSDNDSTSVSVPCAGFKHEDWYRLGVQFQDEFGRWTDPIFLKDVQVGNVPSSLIVESSGGGGGGGDDHGDTDLPLMIAFENKATDNDGVPQWITISGVVEMVVRNPESGANETVSVNLGSTDKIQISGGNYVYFPNAFVADGSQYKGWHLAEGQNCIVKDGEGNITHEIKPLGTSLELSRDNELLITCESTSNPDVDPTPKPEPEPEPPVWDKDFKDLVAEFNKVLNTPVTENSNTWNYLLAAYNMAQDEWNNDSIGLFNIVRDSSVEIYNYRGTYTTYAQQAQESLYSWLMAMCLAELVPSSGSSSNKQTQLYQKAYDLGHNLGWGRSIPLYGNFDAKGDVMLARLVAAGIYAKNRAAYSFDDMDAMRSELGGSVINISGSLTETGLGYDGDKDRGCVSLGYTIGINSIFPAAPGPYLTDKTRTQPHPSSQGQSSDLFYSASDNVSWHKQNYKVDVAVDDEVTSHYNLRINQSTGETEAILKRSVQAVADEKDDAKHWFSEKTYYKYNAGGTYGARFTFTPGTPSDNNGYFTGTFNSEVTGKDLSSLLIDIGGAETDFVYFMNKMGYLGGTARYPLLHSQYGRRRPGQGETDETCRCASPGAEYNLNWLDDSSIARLAGGGTKYDASGGAHAYYIDTNSDGDYDSGEPYYNDSWTPSSPEDELYSNNVFANTYPSGHSSGTFAAALFTIQFFPNHCADIFKAAYKFSVSRTIERAHWNSDITYGRLIGTMMVPIINAIKQNASRKNDFRLLYQSAYNAATGGGPTPPTPPEDASWAEYTGGNGIKYVLHNNSGVEARFSGQVVLNLSKDPNDWDNSQQAYAHMWQSADYHTNDIIIPSGETYTSPEITTITGILNPGTNYTDGTWYLMNTMKQPAGHPVYLYTREYSRSRKEVSGSQHMYAATPTVNTKLQRGYTYHLNVNWVNPGAMLADASLTEQDFLNNHTESYAILAEGKETLG